MRSTELFKQRKQVDKQMAEKVLPPKARMLNHLRERAKFFDSVIDAYIEGYMDGVEDGWASKNKIKTENE